MPEKDYGLAMPSGNRDTTGFEEVFPTETKGDGRVVENNLKTGGEQGRGSSKRKVKCKQCGFPFDVSKNDTSGGSSQGDGAGGTVSITNDYTGKKIVNKTFVQTREEILDDEGVGTGKYHIVLSVTHTDVDAEAEQAYSDTYAAWIATGKSIADATTAATAAKNKFLEYVPNQAYKKGGGCPLCFSKNGAQNNVPTPRSIL